MSFLFYSIIEERLMLMAHAKDEVKKEACKFFRWRHRIATGCMCQLPEFCKTLVCPQHQGHPQLEQCVFRPFELKHFRAYVPLSDLLLFPLSHPHVSHF